MNKVFLVTCVDGHIVMATESEKLATANVNHLNQLTPNSNRYTIKKVPYVFDYIN